MPRYLSPEWLDAAQRAIDASNSMRKATAASEAAADFVVQHVVTGGGDGDLTYHVLAGADGVRIRRGEALDPTVVFTEDYGTAAAIGRGELSAQAAFMAGRIRVHGDLRRLVEQGDAFDEIEEALADLRSETSY
jgi:putative sterol carrier protein